MHKQTTMNNNRIDTFFDSVFYLFGFTENPLKQDVEEILKETPADKMKQDISKVNQSLKSSYSQIKKKALTYDI